MAQAPLRNQSLLTPEELTARLDEMHRAIDEFNDRYYFESHETLEDLWMVTPLPERTFMQGIIQLAAAFVHYARREYPGIIKLLDLSLEKLREFAPETFGVDVAALVDDVARVREEFVSLGPERFLEFDERRAPIVRFVPAGRR
jgi:predicted metal-dependent hydrolase